MATQKIVILGAGNVGRALGAKWSASGHQVSFGVSDPAGKNAQAVRAELGSSAAIGTIEQVLGEKPQIVVLALPGGAVEEIVQQHAQQLDGLMIIDATNRVGEDSMHNLSSLQRLAPQARLYRAFNTLGWENFADPEFNGVQADLFYCGEAAETRSQIEQLIAEVGLRPIYLGGIEQVGLLDALTTIWFTLALKQQKGRHLALKVLGI
ncbi:NADPH-dependent F420 reductase [Tengunoibacter tsumagoiensis]|uniref:Pyrroline-5-carboxylate reductase catalytic N-terminal domain-containing protein n=1 Tax=Tengunoibacter tsumagoiensis TaxID=2014871 RepID=A0A401ZVZ1_9CHLR|nr:NAD(P)-binding domain-containing protein [Tengunoibacter tsumagoiensis]GCE11071.1 hypothetical protein KTT_09300 [Tengunoibacter tsumagoiensis]